jgi:biopolymer transport protein ExbB/TolQ
MRNRADDEMLESSDGFNMNGALVWLQCAWALVVLGLVAERAHALFVRYAVSEAALLFVARSLRNGDFDAARAWAAARPHTLLAALIAPREDADESVDDSAALLSELSHRTHERLLALRVAATLSSTLGLLGGVVAIARGMGGSPGLLGLQAGLAERLAMQDALLSMALGVGTAAVCFHALSRFRARARELVTQLRSVAHLLLETGARRAGF